MNNLEDIGIEKNLQYECIYTTISKNGLKNAAPFAFTYLGEDRVNCHLFKNKTLKNIEETNNYVVNITDDPLAFSYSTIGNLSDDYFTDDSDIAILKNTGSYLVIEVESLDKMSPDEFPVKGNREIYNIIGKIIEFKINDKNVKAFNRGLGCLIDSLVNYTRYGLVDEETKKQYDERLAENARIINKVSDRKTKDAIELLQETQNKL